MTYEKAHKLLLSLEAAEQGKISRERKAYIKSNRIAHDETVEGRQERQKLQGVISVLTVAVRTTPLVAASRVLSVTIVTNADT